MNGEEGDVEVSLNRGVLNRFVFLSAFIALFSSCNSQSDISPEIRWMGNPIINGSPDTSAAHQAVVYIQVALNQYQGFACTGTLIAPQIVLTAGHCVCGEGNATQLSPDKFVVMFGDVAQQGNPVRGVAEVKKHPNYNPNWNYGAPKNDIALLRLSYNAPSSVTPIPYLSSSMGITKNDEGTSLEYVGFGKTESGSSGTKLHVFNDLDLVCTAFSGCNYGQGIAAPNTICEDQTPGGPCSGDSGGPAFITRNGTQYVAGVTSYGDQYCQYFGCSTKVDSFEDFIRDFVGGQNGSSCSSDSQCDSGFCVDGVCCSSSCTAECSACNNSGHLGTCTSLANGTTCGDGDPCNGVDTCQNGTCVSGAPPVCDDNNVCTHDTCLTGSGCHYSPYADGQDCSDGNVCNGMETCQQGVCTSPGWLDCDDHNPCTFESCDEQTGCQHTPKDDGTPCDMGPCGSGTCQNGQCSSAAGDLCDDGLDCTEDYCVEGQGCMHDSRPDGFPCGDCAACFSGACSKLDTCATEDTGCGCSASAGSPLGLFSLVLGLIVLIAFRRWA